MEDKRTVEMGEERLRTQLPIEDDDAYESLESDERKLLSRYGIWLLVELTPPKENVPIVCKILPFLFCAHDWSRCCYVAA